MSQFDKYIKMAQEMINEGTKVEKNGKKMERASISNSQSVIDFFKGVKEGKEKLYMSMLKNDMSPHGGGMIYLSKTPLANENPAAFKSMKSNAGFIHDQIKDMKSKVSKKEDENISNMKVYHVVLNDAISFDKNDTEAEDFFLVV